MRISAGRRWLAVAALALGTAEATVVNTVVTFTDGDFTGTFNSSQAIIHFSSSSPSKTFTWTSENVVVDAINLWTYLGDPRNLWAYEGDAPNEQLINTGNNTDSTHPLSSTTSPHSETPTSGAATDLGDPRGNGGGGPAGGSRRLRNRAQDALNTLQVHADSSKGSVTIRNMDGITPGRPLWLEAVWSKGRSYSRLFTLVEDRGQISSIQDRNLFSKPDPPKSEWGTPAETSSNDDQSPGRSGGQPSETTSSGGKSTDSAAQASGGGGGLSSGAVIGIAVACGVVGLILVFALVWFLLRRRQQKKAIHPVDSAYGSGNRTDELMAEKEAGADVDVTPHSPYSDEGAPAPGPSGTYQDGGAAPHGEAVAAGAVAAAAHHAHHPHQQDQGRSFTPYSDRPSGGAAGTPSVRAASVAQADEPRVSVPSATPGRATPRALTTPYAHLVEEGMTEEEIRRLEDEERQLDAAIEQAGRR